MIEQTGRVVAREGEYAWVEGERSTTCGSCSAKGCGTGALSGVFGRRSQRIRVLNTVEAPVGSEVVVGIKEGAFLRGSVTVYLVPLLAMIMTGLLGELMALQLGLSSAEGLSLALGIAGLVLGFLWVRHQSTTAEKSGRFQAIILRRLEPSGVFSVNTDNLKK